MAHGCKVCGGFKSNESYSGKGHRAHVCKACKSLPAAQRDAIMQTAEIVGFMGQSNISAKNIARLRLLESSPNAQTAEFASVVLDVALTKPHKRRRLRFLLDQRPDLLARMRDIGLVDDFDEDEWVEPIPFDCDENATHEHATSYDVGPFQ